MWLHFLIQTTVSEYTGTAWRVSGPFPLFLFFYWMISPSQFPTQVLLKYFTEICFWLSHLMGHTPRACTFKMNRTCSVIPSVPKDIYTKHTHIVATAIALPGDTQTLQVMWGVGGNTGTCGAVLVSLHKEQGNKYKIRVCKREKLSLCNVIDLNQLQWQKKLYFICFKKMQWASTQV